MPLPVRLPPGVVSVYGVPSTNNIVPANSNFFFGVVDSVNSELPGPVSIGQVVMIDRRGAEQMAYDNNTYYIVNQDNIFFVEITPP